MSWDGSATGRPSDGLRMLFDGHHQQPGLELRLERQRHVHRHLVAVEVGVERGADQRMDPDGLALDQLGLERLDAQPVQRRARLSSTGWSWMISSRIS
jgi:hypothetical protein